MNVVVGSGANSAYETSVGWQTISSSFGGTALGSSAFAGGGWYNTSVGLQANVSGNVDASMALGYNARVIEGVGATLTTNAVAIGTNSTASQSYTVSFGGGITQNHRLVNLANGVDLQDAVTMGQLTTAFAGVAGGTTDQSVFAGRSVTAVRYASNFQFGTVTAATSLSASPSVQVGAGFAF